MQSSCEYKKALKSFGGSRIADLDGIVRCRFSRSIVVAGAAAANNAKI
jgi:hypothetical protein